MLGFFLGLGGYTSIESRWLWKKCVLLRIRVTKKCVIDRDWIVFHWIRVDFGPERWVLWILWTRMSWVDVCVTDFRGFGAMIESLHPKQNQLSDVVKYRSRLKIRPRWLTGWKSRFHPVSRDETILIKNSVGANAGSSKEDAARRSPTRGGGEEEK